VRPGWTTTRPNRLLVMAGAAAAVGVVGALDYVTGSELSVALLYLVPIAIGAWFADLRAGVVLSLLSAGVRLQDLWMEPRLHVHAMTPYWNGAIELGFFVIVAVLMARLRTTTEHWATLARTDALTGALNRRAFEASAGLELARAERYARSLSLFYLDIDDFKQVNDRGGHEDGDRLLVAVAQTLKRNLRGTDLVARYGGDEFVVLLPETGDQAAVQVLDKLMLALRAAIRERWPASVSIGAITVDAPHTTSEQLLKQADKLVYAAKQDGKDCARHRHLHRNGIGFVQNTPSPEPGVRPFEMTAAAGGRGKGR
jgi:diguanylate cyclase (GGDEF)-like protein